MPVLDIALLRVDRDEYPTIMEALFRTVDWAFMLRADGLSHSGQDEQVGWAHAPRLRSGGWNMVISGSIGPSAFYPLASGPCRSLP